MGSYVNEAPKGISMETAEVPLDPQLGTSDLVRGYNVVFEVLESWYIVLFKNVTERCSSSNSNAG